MGSHMFIPHDRLPFFFFHFPVISHIYPSWYPGIPFVLFRLRFAPSTSPILEALSLRRPRRLRRFTSRNLLKVICTHASSKSAEAISSFPAKHLSPQRRRPEERRKVCS